MKAYRHELKYYISRADYELVSRRLSLTMDQDEHASAKTGRYFIRSLYFDDYLDSALREKLGGAGGRDKYRIRIYNMRDNPIRLECKHKEDAFICKEAVALTREQCDKLIAGDFSFLLNSRSKTAQRFYLAFRLKNLKPRVIVDYWREAYVFPLQDVRVTFDSDIRTSYRGTDLFDKRLPTYPAIEDYGMVMEIKYNNFLPGYIRTLIQPVMNAQRSAISKYVWSRKFE